MKARRSVLIQLLALMLAIAMSMMALPLFRGSMRVGDETPLFETLLPVVMIAGLLRATIGVIRGRSLPAIGIYRAFAAGAILFAGQQMMLLGAAAGHVAFTARLLLALIFGLFVGLAPVLGRVEQNPWFGVRTPWTLGSRRVWRDTHRATAKLWFFGGIFGSILAMFGAPALFVIAFLCFLAFCPILISYSAWRRLGRP